MEVRFTQLWLLRFLSINIAQGSVATRLGCGVMFNYRLSRSLLPSLSVKFFLKIY